MKPSLVVMAAGMGSRYGGLKQMDPVGPGGEMILDYSVFDAMRAGFGKVVFIIRRDIEADFKEIVVSRFKDKMPVEYVYQNIEDIPDGFSVPEGRTKPWGTAQAVLCCRDVVHEPFAVINADDLYGRKSYEVLCRHLSDTDPGSDDYCMVGFVLNKTLSDHGDVARGICETDDNGRLVTIVERLKIVRNGSAARYLGEDDEWLDLTGDEIASMNMFGFTPSIFKHLEARFPAFLETAGANMKAEYLLPVIVGELLKEGRAKVDVLSTPERWYGVTYKEDKPVVMESIRAMIKAGEYPENLWQ